MQERVCGAYAATSVENMILCPAAAAAQVGRDAPAVSMADCLVMYLTGDAAIQRAPSALVVRAENIYEQEEEYFVVTARADWNIDEMEVSLLGDGESRPRYRVSGFVAHENNAEVSARQCMRSGHCKAFVRHSGAWYELDDSRVAALSSPPEHFPYVVFLERVDQRQSRGMAGKQAALVQTE